MQRFKKLIRCFHEAIYGKLYVDREYCAKKL